MKPSTPLHALLLAASGVHATGLGVPSYWYPTVDVFDQLPTGCLALINPESGVFAGETTTLSASAQSFVPVLQSVKARGIKALGYVPTGYFNHTAGCNIAGICQTLDRIEAQIQEYYQLFPSLDGIFFDEVSPTAYTCAAFAPEYATLRHLVQSHAPSTATIAYNTAVPDVCAVDAASPGEIVVLYEDSAANYEPTTGNSALLIATEAARDRGVKSWHIVNTAPSLDVLIPYVKTCDPDWFYATNVGSDWRAGDNTYGAPPVYWANETAAFNTTTAAGGGAVSAGRRTRGETRLRAAMTLVATTAACIVFA